MLRLFLFFPLLLLSQDVFTLPDETNHFIYTFSKELSKADKEVHIFSSKLNEYTLISTLKKLSKKKVPLHIFTSELSQEDNKASYLSLLVGVHVYSLAEHKDRLIKGSLVCIDDKKLYLSTQSLDKVSLYSDYAFVVVKETKCKHLFNKLKEKSTKIQ